MMSSGGSKIMDDIIIYIGFILIGVTCILSASLFVKLKIPAVISYMFKFKKGDRYYLKMQRRKNKPTVSGKTKVTEQTAPATSYEKTEIITSVENYAMALLSADSTVVLDDMQMTEFMKDE